jgi:hypothetical protein
MYWCPTCQDYVDGHVAMCPSCLGPLSLPTKLDGEYHNNGISRTDSEEVSMTLLPLYPLLKQNIEYHIGIADKYAKASDPAGERECLSRAYGVWSFGLFLCRLEQIRLTGEQQAEFRTIETTLHQRISALTEA